MTVLKKQASVFPDDLLDEFTISHSARRWWVLYTRPRHEKSVARRLVSYDVPFFLPLVPTRSLRRKTVTSYVPLFSGYVFMFGDESERVKSLTTNRIFRVLPVGDPERMLLDLRQLRQLIDAGAPVTVERRLEPGRRVRVRSGSLAGMEGIVVKRRGESRLVICIDFLQQGASIVIEDHMVEPVY